MKLSGKAKVAGVIGWPISHSKSPLLHGFWLDQLGIDGAYIPLLVHPDDLDLVIRSLPKMGFVGLDVTVPHKQTVMPLVDELTQTARRAGAVNTVIVGKDGRLTGDSTDGYGFLSYLHERIPAFDCKAGAAVLLGSGGAARSIAAALVDDGVPELRLVCRTQAAGEEIAAAIGGPVKIHLWSEAETALTDTHLLINATLLGMMGKPPLSLSLDRLPRAAAVYDIVYAPLETELLANARRRGHLVVDGLGMLIHQARPAFHSFFGMLPEASPELRALLLS